MNTLKLYLKKVPYLKLCVNQLREKKNLLLDRLNYVFSIVSNKPYFGNIYQSGQTQKLEIPVMEDFIYRIAKDNFTMLELGSWVGSSARIWGNALKKFKNCKVLCIDNYSLPEEYHWSHLGQLKAIKTGKAVKLFKRNIRALELEDIVSLLKTSHQEASRVFKDNSIDFIYIDLGHDYNEMQDILERYLPLVKKGGWIGGDDYDSNHDYKRQVTQDILGEVNNKGKFWYKNV